VSGITAIPHPEEGAKRPSRRTHRARSEIPYSSRSASRISRNKAEVAFGVEKPGLGVGRQFAQHLGEGAKDGLDILCFEPPLSCQTALPVAEPEH
jgi:hypothetical protein